MHFLTTVEAEVIAKIECLCGLSFKTHTAAIIHAIEHIEAGTGRDHAIKASWSPPRLELSADEYLYESLGSP